MNSAKSSSHQNGSPDMSHGDQMIEQELLAIEDAIEQDDVAVLKSQLAAAHQLLQYQKTLVHSLTEQIQIQDMHLQHAERQVDELQQDCQSQTVELAEMRSICTDLRSLLKRQTRRSTPVQTPVAPQQPSPSIAFEVQPARPVRTSVSFGYESVAQLTTEAQHLTKAPPVKAWSAPQTEEFREEITFCQKLTTFVMSSTARLTTAEAESVLDAASRSISLPERDSVSMRPSAPTVHQGVELPRFALG